MNNWSERYAAGTVNTTRDMGNMSQTLSNIGSAISKISCGTDSCNNCDSSLGSLKKGIAGSISSLGTRDVQSATSGINMASNALSSHISHLNDSGNTNASQIATKMQNDLQGVSNQAGAMQKLFKNYGR